MKLLGIEMTNEEFDYLMCEQANGKLLKVVDDKVVAVDYVLTEEEIKRNRIAELNALLEDYDYIGTKIATGRGTREEYAEQIAQMTAWANEINELEASL